jgi:hypothetical protein
MAFTALIAFGYLPGLSPFLVSAYIFQGCNRKFDPNPNPKPNSYPNSKRNPNPNSKPNPNPKGPYKDFTPVWYSTAGVFFLQAFIVQTVVPSIQQLVPYFITQPLMRAIKYPAVSHQRLGLE